MKIEPGPGGMPPSTPGRLDGRGPEVNRPAVKTQSPPVRDAFLPGPAPAPSWQLNLLRGFALPVQEKTIQNLGTLLRTWSMTGLPQTVADKRVLTLGLLMLHDGVVLEKGHVAALARARAGKMSQGSGPGAEIRTIPDLFRHVMDDAAAREARNKEVLPHVLFPLYLLNLPSQYAVPLAHEDEAWGFEAPGGLWSLWRLRVHLTRLGPLQLTLWRRGKQVGIEVLHADGVPMRPRDMIANLLRDACRTHLGAVPSVKFRIGDFSDALPLDGNEWVLEELTAGEAP